MHLSPKPLALITGVCAIVVIVLAGLNFRGNTTNPNLPHWGIAGFSPIGFPSLLPAEVTEYFGDLNKYTSVYGVHTQLSETQILKLVTNNYDHDISLVIDYRDAGDVEGIAQVLSTYPQIKYLGIGNEINLVYERDKDAYAKFVAEYKQAYPALKTKFPNLQIFTVYQYETLIGQGKLTGIKHENLTHIINDLAGELDMIGLTVYPFFDYDLSPAEYFTQMPPLKIAITETAWPGSSGAQEAHLRWLQRQVDLHPGRFVFINWLFLNDLPGAPAPFSDVGLRDSAGQARAVWEQWQVLTGK